MLFFFARAAVAYFNCRRLCRKLLLAEKAELSLWFFITLLFLLRPSVSRKKIGKKGKKNTIWGKKGFSPLVFIGCFNFLSFPRPNFSKSQHFVSRTLISQKCDFFSSSLPPSAGGFSGNLRCGKFIRKSKKETFCVFNPFFHAGGRGRNV